MRCSMHMHHIQSSVLVQHCLQMMTDHRLRHLPVVAEGELIGMLSIGDLVKQTIDDQASLIQQLEQYSRGG